MVYLYIALISLFATVFGWWGACLAGSYILKDGVKYPFTLFIKTIVSNKECRMLGLCIYILFCVILYAGYTIKTH